METLQEFDPETAARVRAMSLLREHDRQQLLLQEGLPPTFKRKAYIVHAAHGLLVTDVLWQFTAFHEVTTVMALEVVPSCETRLSATTLKTRGCAQAGILSSCRLQLDAPLVPHACWASRDGMRVCHAANCRLQHREGLPRRA